jgi:glycosyltransferase involved in cell wall biosynthesis
MGNDATQNAAGPSRFSVLGSGHRPHEQCAENPPVFGFVLLGGALTGALVAHVRLANEMARRGYPVHAWWAMDRPVRSPLRGIATERWLFNSTRYGGFSRLRGIDDLVGQYGSRLIGDTLRNLLIQKVPIFFHRQIREFIRVFCTGVERDRRLIRRFARQLTRLRVTHVLPTIECLAPFVAAARPFVPHDLRFLLTYQSYEVLATYARQIGMEAEFYAVLADMTRRSDWRAVAVSAAYRDRICADVGVRSEELHVIHSGAPHGTPMEPGAALEIVRAMFPEFREDLPLVSYVGRRDSEKGLDLLLYAAKILRARGIELQLAVCGPTAFDRHYIEACRQIAWNLRLPVLWGEFVSDEVRTALFRMSRTVAYPSIHEEAFGMVPVEAMVQSTPVIVPDVGGVASLVRVGRHEAGLNFSCWDSGDLAQQLERLLTDSDLHARLAADTRAVADNFSVERQAERFLEHLHLPPWHAEQRGELSPRGMTGARSELRRAA